MFLVGARWNKETSSLEEQDFKIISYKMPFIRFIPISKENLIEDDKYECPVYITSTERESLCSTGHSKNFILSLLLPTKESPKHWIKRNVAVLCQLNSTDYKLTQNYSDYW